MTIPTLPTIIIITHADASKTSKRHAGAYFCETIKFTYYSSTQRMYKTTPTSYCHRHLKCSIGYKIANNSSGY